MEDEQKNDALAYHSLEPKGKLQVLPSKPMATQHDLSLAYSPGVAYPCLEIEANPDLARDYTMRGNLVGVVTNGTAVLGLGDIGPLAAKPVMEGKGALFKKFSGIDVFDIEVAETDVDAFCAAVKALEPTFGGINLEDIKAPDAFEIEARLKAEMNIPVFHDDQHGTAIVSAAAALNALKLVGKNIGDIRISANGAGAASIACLDLLISFGAKKENITVCDSKGVIYPDRPGRPMHETKLRYARPTELRSLADAVEGSDLFLGLSVGGALTPEMVATMAEKPIILAMANPEPEIRPEAVAQVRDDAIMATGRSDYPNQVNNVLCFPFIFRGALDVGATGINEEMKMACARALAAMAQAEASDVVLSAYGGEDLKFGPDYIIPKPFDPRLVLEVAPAVAQAAMDTGVATRPIADMDAYRTQLSRFVYQSGMLMKPIFATAAQDPRRILFAEGEDTRVLHVALQAQIAGVAKPVLLGDADAIEARISALGLPLTIGGNLEVVDPGKIDPEPYADALHDLVGRDGVSPREALRGVQKDTSGLAMLMLKQGQVDGVILGTNGRYDHHLTRLRTMIGLADGCTDFFALTGVVSSSGTIFVADTHVNPDPSAEQIVEMTLLAAKGLRNLGLEPKVALISHSNFGSRPTPASKKMRLATAMLRERNPDFEFDGEMHADAALDPKVRAHVLKNSTLSGAANLLIMPNLDAAHISMNLLRSMTNGVAVGPVTLGAKLPVQIVHQSIKVRGLLNIAAITTVEAQQAG